MLSIGGDSWVVMRDAARFDGSYVVQLLHTELSCYSEQQRCEVRREEVLRSVWAERWTGTQTWHSFYRQQSVWR